MEEIKIAKKLENANIQSMLCDSCNYKLEDVDSRLATGFYNFLSGKSNRFPSTDLISESFELAQGSIISVGHGIVVYYNSEDDVQGKIKINYESLSDDNNTKFEEITAERHTYYSIDNEGNITPTLSSFNERRVEAIQKFILDYTNVEDNLFCKVIKKSR